MADVLTYVLHYEGALNKNSLGAVSEGAARAAEIGGECEVERFTALRKATRGGLGAPAKVPQQIGRASCRERV